MVHWGKKLNETVHERVFDEMIIKDRAIRMNTESQNMLYILRLFFLLPPNIRVQQSSTLQQYRMRTTT